MSPSQLDFGDALMHEQTGREVMVTNSSLLAQDIGGRQGAQKQLDCGTNTPTKAVSCPGSIQVSVP